MHETDALELTRHAILMALQLTLPLLSLAMVVGIMISLFQAVTQIQEQTLTFVPKIVIMAGALIVLGPWILHTLVGFMSSLLNSLPTTIH